VITREQFKSMFPNASRSFAEVNPGLSHPKPERVVQDEPVGKGKREKEGASRVIVCVTAFRCRLTDPDNLCPKYVIDALRYAGAIHDDREQDIQLRLSQKKVGTTKEERTEIELIWP